MAWMFINPNDTESRARRQLIADATARWWSAFAAKRAEIEAELASSAGTLDASSAGAEAERVLPVSPELTEWMNGQIARLDSRLHWEFGQGPGEASGLFHLVITAGDCLRLRPMAASIIAAAPTSPGWQFHGHRQPVQAHWAIEAARRRTGLKAFAPSVLSRLGSNNRIDMIFKMKVQRDDEASAVVLAAGLAEAVLGEDAFLRWVGEIDVEPLERGPAAEAYLGLSQLRGTVSGLIHTITSALPSQPLHVRPAPKRWPSFKFDATPSTDYARQDDVLVGRSIVPAVRAAAFGEKPGRKPKFPFYSSCFSHVGEIFCYLKVDTPGLSIEKRRSLKYQIEETLDPALRNARAGCVIGSCTGLKYLYLDLAVVNIKQSLAVLAPVLRPLSLPSRTWLLFYDTEMADEYIGMNSSSGAPPAIAPGAADFSRRPPARPAPVELAEAPSGGDLQPNQLMF